MADITLSYKGSTIAEISDSATKTMNTAGKYCEDNITLVYVKPSGGAQFTLTVSVDSGSTVTATDGTSTVTGTSVNDECVLTLPNAGTWTVTATLGGGSASKVVVAEDSFAVELAYVDSVLANNTPTVIQKVAQAGTGANYWSVGDKTAEITFQNVTVGSLSMNGLSFCAYILGFNHNQAIEGTGIHFQFGKSSGDVSIAFCDSKYYTQPTTTGPWFNMNANNKNNGGWNGSRMRTTICPAFKTALPTDWQNVIASCTKYTDNTGGGNNTASYVTSTSDEIFLLAEFEVFGVRSLANSAEQNYQLQYAYFANGNSKQKFQHASTSTGCSWWLRSVGYSNNLLFCRVHNNGNANNYSANYSLGFAPAFMVG